MNWKEFTMKYGGGLTKYQKKGEVSYSSVIDPKTKKINLEAFDRLQSLLKEQELIAQSRPEGAKTIPEIQIIGERPGLGSRIRNVIKPYVAPEGGFLDQWRQRIVDATGGADWYKQPNSVLNAFSSIVTSPLQAPQYAAVYAATDGKLQLPSEALDIQNPVGSFLTDVALDPMTYVGLGVSKIPQKIGQAAIPSIEQAGKYLTTQTPLRNAYNLIPEGTFSGYSKLKNPNKSYRVAGMDAYDDFIESGILRSKQQGLPEGATFAERVMNRPTGFPSFQKGYADLRYLPEKGGVVFETSLPTFKRGEINPITGQLIKGRHYAHRVIDPQTGAAMGSIPGENISVYASQPHWLKGYPQLNTSLKKYGGIIPKGIYQGGGPTIDLKLPQFGEDKPRPFFDIMGAGTGPQYDMFSHSYVPLGKNLGISADLMGFKEGDWRVGRYGISGNINIPINRGERRTRPDVKDLPIYQKRGELTFNDSLRHQAGKILSYEQLRGGPGGIPLPQYGDPKYLNMLMNDVYPEVKKIMPNATAMEAGEAMDFIFNAGWDKENKKILKDPRAYALQEYYRQYDKSKLDKEGNWPGRKQPITNELYSSTIGKLPENQRRILMNRGRDWYYKNTNNPAPGVPNPNYDATWYGRIWNTNDFLPFNPNNPRFTPTKQYGGDELDDYQYGGGFLPTRYTSNPYDPAIKYFNDSLNLYKGYVMQDYLMGPKNERISPGTRISWTPAELKKDRTKKWNPILKQKIADDFQNQEEMFASDFVNENNKKLVRYYKSLGFTDDNIMYHTSADLVHPTIRAIGTYMDGSALSPIYKKPVQPVKYADPKVVEKQKILKDAGLYTGELDGIWGSGSEKAWKEYTERNTTPRSLDGMTEVTYPTSTMIETTKLDPNGNPVTEIHYYDDLRTRERKDPKVQKYLIQTYNQMSTPYKKAAVAKYGDPSKVPFEGVNIYELNPNPYMKEEGGETNLFNWNNLDQWFKNGGESDFVNNIYSDYMDGIYDGTPLEENAKKVYDKLNNMYYRLAKESGMTPPNYIMTNVIKKALKPS